MEQIQQVIQKNLIRREKQIKNKCSLPFEIVQIKTEKQNLMVYIWK